MNSPTYQQIFDAFNSCKQDAGVFTAAQDFQTISASPEVMLKTLGLVRTIGTPQQLQYHRTTYLRGLITALYKCQWQPRHTKGLIEATDWLISLKGDTTHVNHASRYLTQLRILANVVQQKVDVPEKKKAEWEKVLAKKKQPTKFRPFYAPEIVCERRSAHITHPRVFDDRI